MQDAYHLLHSNYSLCCSVLGGTPVLCWPEGYPSPVLAGGNPGQRYSPPGDLEPVTGVPPGRDMVPVIGVPQKGPGTSHWGNPLGRDMGPVSGTP